MSHTAGNPAASSSDASASELREYHTTDKAAWGSGPWADEPDKMQWKDRRTGFPCLIVRGPTGSLCGYVGLPPEHPLYGSGYDDVPADVHGGLTYAAACRHGADEARGICHVPAAGEPDTVWWFGFDCAHAGDYSPAYDQRDHPVLGLGRPTGWGGVIEYRDVGYVRDQVFSLAVQLAALSGRLAEDETAEDATGMNSQ